MSKILEIAKNLIGNLQDQAIEEAAGDIEVLDPLSIEEQYILYLSAALTRANKVLDKNKETVFAQVLDLNSRARVERAVGAYDKPYLLSLGLSLEATSELARNLIDTAERFKVSPPRAWKEVAMLNIDLKGEDLPMVSRKRPVV